VDVLPADPLIPIMYGLFFLSWSFPHALKYAKNILIKIFLMVQVIILQLIFILPFAIYASFSLAKTLRGITYTFQKSQFFVGLILLTGILAALTVRELGILTYTVFFVFPFFLYLIFFAHPVVKTNKSIFKIILKTFLFIMPFVVVIILNYYLFVTSSIQITEGTSTASEVSNLLPKTEGSVPVISLVALLLLVSSSVQCASYLIESLIDKLSAHSKHYAN